MKHNIYFLFLFILLSIFETAAQIGVNNADPKALIHIKSDNLPDRDIVITDKGQIGIGTIAVDDQARVHVKGSIKIQDGTEGSGKFLVTDKNGIGSWKQGLALHPFIIWSIHSTSFAFPAPGTPIALKGLTDLDHSDLEARMMVDGLFVPAGRYIVYFRGGINQVEEYGYLRLMNFFDKVIIEANYINDADGMSFVIDLPEETPITLEWEAIDTGGVYYAVPPYTAGYRYTVTLVRIDY